MSNIATKSCLGFVVLVLLLPIVLMAEDSIEPMPKDYPLHARVAFDEEHAFLMLRVINDSDEVRPLALATITSEQAKISPACDPFSVADKDVIVPGGHGPVAVFDIKQNVPVTEIALGRNEYVGRRVPLYAEDWFDRFKAAVIGAPQGTHWMLGFVTAPCRSGPTGAIRDQEVVLSSNYVVISKSQVQAIAKIGQQEKIKAKAVKPEGSSRFDLVLSADAERGKLYIDLVCANPRGARVEGRTWTPSGENVDVQCIAPESSVWSVIGNGKVVEKITRPTTQEAVSASRILFLDRDNIVGRVVDVASAPFLPAVQKWFDDSKKIDEQCAIVLNVRLTSLTIDGKASTDTELESKSLVITRAMFEKILASTSIDRPAAPMP